MSTILLLAACAWAAPQADEHTVLLLHLDEGSGITCADSSAQGIEARLDVAPREPQWVEGRFGKCLRFDGDNADSDGDDKGEADGLLVLGEGKLAQSGPVTVEMWIRPERLVGNQTLCALNCFNGRYTFFLSGAGIDVWMAYADDDGKLTYRNVRTAPVLEVDRWQHVALTYDGEAMRAFVNGLQVAEREVGFARYSSESVSAATIGRDGDLRPVSAGIRGFKGLIDEVRVSKIAREQFDVPPELTEHTRKVLAERESDNRFATPYADPEPIPVNDRDVRVTGTVSLDGQPLAGAQVTDGDAVVSTGADGRYSLGFHVAENRYVCATRPDGSRPVTPWAVLIDPGEERTEYEIDFGFVADRQAARSVFTFLQTSDSQFRTAVEMGLLREEYAQITAMTGEPAFLVCPGDLTMSGTYYELDMYREIWSAASIDVYNVFGGHDGNYAAPNYSVGNYERKIGPPHFAWNYGGVHFMAWITEGHYLSEEAKGRQARWLERDLAAQPKGTPVMLVTHIPHGRGKLSEWLDEGYNIIGGLYGHWHAVSQNEYRGVHFLNCSPIRGGDWGALTRCFRVNTIENGKLARSEVRATGQQMRVELIAPQGEVTHPPPPIRALAFDSSCRVTSVEAEISRAAETGTGAQRVPLQQIGQWTWGSDVPAMPAEPGRYEVLVRVVDERGRQWETKGEYSIVPGDPAPAKPGQDFPSVLGGAGGHRTGDAPLTPPLRISWVVNTGGRNQLGISPIVYRGRVYVGVRTNDVAWKGAGIACYDAATGRSLWRADTDSAIRFAPAAIDGIIVAVSQQGVVYGLDADTGDELWTYDLYPIPPSYIYRSVKKPVVIHGTNALVARDGTTSVLLDARTGKVVKQYDGETGIYYGFSTVGGDKLLSGARGKCEAYDMQSGERLWSSPATTGKGTSPPVEHEGHVYMNAGYLHCYDAGGGDLVWKRAMSIGSNGVSAPVFWGDLVIANGAVIAAFEKASGEPAWEFRYPDPNTEQNRRQRIGGMSAPVVVGDMVYVGGEDGRLYALDAATGTVLWRYYLGLPVKCWPAASGNALYVSDYDGNLWAFVSG